MIEIYGTEFGFCRSEKCSYTNKWNRAVKLAYRFEELSNKFDGMIERGKGLTENARLALACKMMMYTGIRIGNEDSAEGYMTKPHPNSKVEPMFVQTYGLTTLLKEHCVVKGRKVEFLFLGKKHVDNYFEVSGSLARQIKELLCNYNDEKVFGITNYQLTKFIKKYVGRQFTPKDFRTMKANMYAWEKLEEICEREQPTTKRAYNAEVKEVAEYVSGKLNNTPGVCKKNYIDEYFWNEMYALRHE